MSEFTSSTTNEDCGPPDFFVEPCDVREAKFRWIYLGCLDQSTIKDLEHDLIELKKPVASDLAAASEDAELWYVEILAVLNVGGWRVRAPLSQNTRPRRGAVYDALRFLYVSSSSQKSVPNFQ